MNRPSNPHSTPTSNPTTQSSISSPTYEEADALIHDLAEDRKILKYADRFAEMKIKPAF